MSWVDDALTEQFYEWELRGRGWQVFDTPVAPEPPFTPFIGHFLPEKIGLDDGRHQTLLSSILAKLRSKLSTVPPLLPPIAVEDEVPEPEPFERGSLIEIQTSLPANLNVGRDGFDQFLAHLSLCNEPIAFELLGSSERIVAQFAMEQSDAALVRKQLQAYFPDAVFVPQKETLMDAWFCCEDAAMAILEFGLSREFMLPLASGKIDPFVGLCGALSELSEHELGLFQILFQPAKHKWSESVVRSLSDAEAKPFFVNCPELLHLAEKKISRQLYGVVVRIATRAAHFDRAWEVARELSSGLCVFASPEGNALIPLSNEDYPSEAHEEDVLRRQSRRSGMLLNAEELIGFVHLPSIAVRAQKLLRQTTTTKAAPKSVLLPAGLLLGANVHAGIETAVRLTTEQRVRHVHIIGASGTGKSTLLFNLIKQDIENGEGLAVLDPHGDLVERIHGAIPPNRLDDVVLLDPTDEEYSIGFNILSAHSDFEKNLLSSDLVSVFKRLSTSWGDQMGSVLNNAILAFLESAQGGTLADLRRFLLDSQFRNDFLTTVCDPDIVYYWQNAFPQLGGNKSIGPVLTRLDTFLSPKPIRYMVSQKTNRLDFANILDSGKIFLAKLPQGQMGKENSFLLGSLLVSKLQQLAMSRQRLAQDKRRDFWLYIDEFHYFITASMAEILTGARKYRLGLILAHHELHQLQRDSEVASAVMSHPYTRIVFRVGDADARELEKGFSSFRARDLQNLPIGEAVCRVERSDSDFNLKVRLPEEQDQGQAAEMRRRVITASREKYASPRAIIESELLQPHKKNPGAPPKSKKASVEPASAKETQRTIDASAANLSKVSLDVTKSRVQAPADQPKSTPKAPNVHLSPPDMGRGGAQHQAIQQRLKTAAEQRDFRATIEKEILAGHGSVDLLLERSPHVLACEISITTTIDHEVGNVAKCLKAGFARVVVIASTQDRLDKIKSAVTNSLKPSPPAAVSYFLPDEFIEHLQTLTQASQSGAPAPADQVSRGYRVKTTIAKLAPDELRLREDAAIKAIAETMRKKKLA